MRKLFLVALIVSSFVILSSPGKAEDREAPYKLIAALVETLDAEKIQTDRYKRMAVLCFLTGERVSGFNKICFYNCLGSMAAITIPSLQFCPLSINR
ncbi:MAG: hypothetical protein V3R83_11925 [Gammaproteobacteria bacterium]